MTRLVISTVLGLSIWALSASVAAGEIDQWIAQAEAVRSSDPARFAQLLGKLEAVSTKSTPLQQQQIRLLRAYRRALVGEYNEAISTASQLFRESDNVSVRFRAGLLVANTAAVTRDFTLGLRFLEESMALQDQLSDAETRQHGYGVAAILYNQFGQYALGKHYSDLLLTQELAPRMHCVAEMLRIEARQGLGESLDAASEIEPAIERCEREKEAIPANLTRTYLARQLAAQGHLERAVSLLKTNLPAIQATGYAGLIAEARSLLAQYELDMGHKVDAEAHARAVTRIKGREAARQANVIAHHVLYRTALARGDLATALDEYRLYAAADKARLDDIKAKELAFQLSRLEVKQKNQSIELLKNQNQVLRLQQELATKSAWNFRLAMALLVVIALMATYWGYRARRMNRSLKELAQTDGLTGLSNRRHFRALTEASLAHMQARGRPVSVLLFDLDHFKQINDQCGHAAGDWVLREVARVGRRHCRQADVYGRIGGEEFALTLIDCDLETARRIAEECRASIAGIDAVPGGCTLPVSASVGCVSTIKSGYDYETLIAHADAAMYRSKVAGRNRVTVYEPSSLGEDCDITRARRSFAAALADAGR